MTKQGSRRFFPLLVSSICCSLFYTVPLSAQSYAQWYAESQDRIDTLRKGDFQIQVYDRDGQLYSGPVSIRMQKHEYPFGIAVDLYKEEPDPDAVSVAGREEWMKAAMYKYFNYGVSGNSFKWSGIQPQPTAPDYRNFENMLAWTQKVGWDLRAHTLLWGGDDDHSMPAWVRELPGPQAITDACEMRVTREVTRYRGLVKEYDVINEPLTGHADHLRNTVGDSIIWNCFKWARAADPDAELFVNDYNVEYNWGQAEEYRDLILKIQEMGGPVSGIGIQAHFWDCCRPNIDELVKNLNIIAEAGLPMRFTEYDYGGNLNQAEQAKDMIKVMTVAFSHPSMTGMIFWGLDDEGAWRTNTGLFDSQKKPKMAADSLLYYTKTKWATNFDAELAGGAAMDINAYFGEYHIEISFGDTLKFFRVPFLKDNADSLFVLHESMAEIKGPKLVATELLGDDRVRLSFDGILDTSTVFRGDFRFFSNTGVGINEISAEKDSTRDLTLTLSKGVAEGDYLTVSYFPGRLRGSNGSTVQPFGPQEIKNTLYLPDSEILVEASSLEEQQFVYSQGFGPSDTASFTVSGTELQGDVNVRVTQGYELSLDPAQGYSPSLMLIQSDGLLPEITVYVRLAEGLDYRDYQGTIVLSSEGASDLFVYMSGKVNYPPYITQSATSVTGLSYTEGVGPSDPYEFRVSGMWIYEPIILMAEGNFELSLTADANYASSLQLSTQSETLAETPVFVRLSGGLGVDVYEGRVSLGIYGEEMKEVLLYGEVLQATAIGENEFQGARVVSRSYFTLMGREIRQPEDATGVYIERIILSDGRVINRKIFRKYW